MLEVSSEPLRGLDYAFYKFRKPLEHVSVDVLVHYEHLLKAIKALASKDFRIEVSESYTVTMVKGGTIVDLYTHPSFAWIVYLDGERLLEETETIDMNFTSVEAKALTKDAEVIVTAAHAIYKEHIYLLADYYVVKYWLNNRALSLARELGAEEVVKTALRLNEQIERGQIEASVKLKPIMEILARKFEELQNNNDKCTKTYSEKESYATTNPEN